MPYKHSWLKRSLNVINWHHIIIRILSSLRVLLNYCKKDKLVFAVCRKGWLTRWRNSIEKSIRYSRIYCCRIVRAIRVKKSNLKLCQEIKTMYCRNCRLGWGSLRVKLGASCRSWKTNCKKYLGICVRHSLRQRTTMGWLKRGRGRVRVGVDVRNKSLSWSGWNQSDDIYILLLR
jgi:hypothetical protein